MSYKIITDSGCDFTKEKYAELGLAVAPLMVNFRGESYPDRNDESLKDLYAGLRAGEVSTTAAVNPEQWTEAMEPVLKADEDVLVLAFSSGLSATYDSARLAGEELREKYPERKLFVVDTLCASMGEGLLVWHAGQLKKQGKTIEEVRDWAEENKLHLCHQFTVDDLHFLKRGGRISATTAAVGSMLKIKPVLHVNNEGKLVNIGKARGRKASLNTLVDRMEATAVNPGEQTVFISHGDSLEDAQYVARLVSGRMGVKDIRINYVGPVIGAHSGPGTLALFYLGTER